MNFLVEQENTRQIDLANNALFGPNLPILLPEYNPTKPFPIVLHEYDPTILTQIGPYQCADWDETQSKCKIRVVMKYVN